MAAIDAAQHLPHAGLGQLARAERNGLVGQRQRIAHRAARGARQQPQRARLGRHALRTQHIAQVHLHVGRGHRAQVELQAARQHGDRHLLRVGRREHELQVLGRLLQRLEHRVERGVRQHVHFVDHVDLEAADDRLVDRLVQQLRDLLDAAVGGGIELHVVDEAALVDVAAGVAHATGLGGDAALAVGPGAVQALGQDARHRRLADAARAGEQIGMVQPALGQGVGQGLHDMLLADELLETLRAVFAGQDLVTHGGGF
mmetsp:Transcript_38418/g.106772  ORF Transcript_38418/g.106772 Transcript_38418/m.106772 type:complete len:258 (-) Transcript_38418:416-1189(-)